MVKKGLDNYKSLRNDCVLSCSRGKESGTNGFKLQRRLCLNIRKNFLIVQTVWQLNGLPLNVVDSSLREVFKQRLDSHLLGMLLFWTACFSGA